MLSICLRRDFRYFIFFMRRKHERYCLKAISDGITVATDIKSVIRNKQFAETICFDKFDTYRRENSIQ